MPQLISDNLGFFIVAIIWAKHRFDYHFSNKPKQIVKQNVKQNLIENLIKKIKFKLKLKFNKFHI